MDVDAYLNSLRRKSDRAAPPVTAKIDLHDWLREVEGRKSKVEGRRSKVEGPKDDGVRLPVGTQAAELPEAAEFDPESLVRDSFQVAEPESSRPLIREPKEIKPLTYPTDLKDKSKPIKVSSLVDQILGTENEQADDDNVNEIPEISDDNRFNRFFNDSFAKPFYSFVAGSNKATGSTLDALNKWSKWLGDITGLDHGGIFGDLSKLYYQNADYYHSKGIPPEQGLLNDAARYLYEGSGEMAIILPTLLAMGKWALPIYSGAMGGAESISEGKSPAGGFVKGAVRGMALKTVLGGITNLPSGIGEAAGGLTFGSMTLTEEFNKPDDEIDWSNVLAQTLIGIGLSYKQVRPTKQQFAREFKNSFKTKNKFLDRETTVKISKDNIEIIKEIFKGRKEDLPKEMVQWVKNLPKGTNLRKMIITGEVPTTLKSKIRYYFNKNKLPEIRLTKPPAERPAKPPAERPGAIVDLRLQSRDLQKAELSKGEPVPALLEHQGKADGGKLNYNALINGLSKQQKDQLKTYYKKGSGSASIRPDATLPMGEVPIVTPAPDITAEFIGYQKNARGVEELPLFNISGGPNDGSTVSKRTLYEQGIDIPEHPRPHKPKPANILRLRKRLENLGLDDGDRVKLDDLSGTLWLSAEGGVFVDNKEIAPADFERLKKQKAGTFAVELTPEVEELLGATEISLGDREVVPGMTLWKKDEQSFDVVERVGTRALQDDFIKGLDSKTGERIIKKIRNGEELTARQMAAFEDLKRNYFRGKQEVFEGLESEPVPDFKSFDEADEYLVDRYRLYGGKDVFEKSDEFKQKRDKLDAAFGAVYDKELEKFNESERAKAEFFEFGSDEKTITDFTRDPEIGGDEELRRSAEGGEGEGAGAQVQPAPVRAAELREQDDFLVLEDEKVSKLKPEQKSLFNIAPKRAERIRPPDEMDSSDLPMFQAKEAERRAAAGKSQLSLEEAGSRKQEAGKAVEYKRSEYDKPTSEQVTALNKAIESTKDLPIKVSPDDVDAELIYRAHSGTSFSPDEKPSLYKRDYINNIVETYNELKRLAKSEAQQEILKTELERYKTGYLEKMRDYMHSHSRVVSTMIAGPSNFPTRTMEKRNNAVHNKLTAWLEWEKKARKSIKRKLKRQSVEDQGGEYAVMEKKLAHAKKAHDIMKQSNAIIRKKTSDEDKITEMVKTGMKESHARELLKPDYMGKKGVATWQLSNNLANIKRMEQRLAEMKSRESKTGEDIILKTEGVKVVNNYDEERVKILFDEIPDSDLKVKLKSSGWHWSPRNQAWQRKNTKNAIYNVSHVLGGRFDVTGAKFQTVKDQTETPEFKKWFGKSKVVDDKGKPLVVYHGTPSGDFTVFKPDMFFTTNKEYADVYQSTSASSRNFKRPLTIPKTYDVYLRIQKPFDTRTNERSQEIWDEFVGNNDTEYYSYGMALTEKGLPGWLEADNLKSFMEEKGYLKEFDGFILDEGGTGGYDQPVIDRGISYFPFSPTQIKSATENIGKYDPNNPDIRYQKSIDIESLSTSEEQMKVVRRLLPEVKARAVKRIRDADGREALGQYLGGVISISENPKVTTGYHEVVHGYLDMYVGKFDRNKIFDDYRARSKEPGTRTDDEIEERIAEDFYEFYTNDKRPKSFLRKLFEKIKAVIDRLLGRLDRVKDLYQKIVAQKRPKTAPESLSPALAYQERGKAPAKFQKEPGARSQEPGARKIDKAVDWLEKQIPEGKRGEIERHYERTLIKQKIEIIKRGYRMGQIDKDREIRWLQKTIKNYARKHLPQTNMTRGQVVPIMTKLEQARTEKDFDEAIQRIEEIRTKVDRMSALDKTLHLIDNYQPKTTDKKRQIGTTLTAVEYAKMTDIRKLVRMKPDEVAGVVQQIAQRAVADDREPDPDEREAIYLASVFGDLKHKGPEEIKNALDEINHIIDTGRSRHRQLEEKRRDENRMKVNKVIENITGGKGHLSEMELRDEGLDKKNYPIRTLDDYQLGLESLLDKLERFDKESKPNRGYVTKHYTDMVHDSRNVETKGSREAFEYMNAKLEEIYGVSGRKLSRLLDENTERIKTNIIIDQDGKMLPMEISQNEAYKLWQWWQDPWLHDKKKPTDKTVWDTMNIDETVMHQIENFMKPEVRAWAEWQLKEFYPKYYIGINDVYKDQFYVDLPFNPFYTPITRDVKGEREEDQLLQAKNQYASVMSGHLKSRVRNNQPLKYRDGDNVLVQHILEMEHFKGWAKTIREMRAVLQNNAVQMAINQYHGQTASKILNKMIDDLARGGIDRLMTFQIADKLRGNFVKAVIGLNPVTFYKQLMSIPAYAGEMPVADWIAGLAKFAANPAKAIKILGESEMIKSRYKIGWERDVVAAMHRGTAGRLADVRKFSDLIMSFTKFGDRAAIYIGGYPLYDFTYRQQIALKRPEVMAREIAMREFEKATARAQQDANIQSLSHIQRMGSIAKLFTMFMTSKNQYYRQTSGAWRNMREGRGDFKENLKKMIIFHFILPMLFQWAADGYNINWKRQLRAILLGSFNGLFVVGDIAETVGKGISGESWNDYLQIPVLSPVENYNRAVRRTMRMIGKDDFSTEDVLKAVDELAKGTGKVTGVPYGPVKREIKNIRDFATGEDKDVRRLLGYSEYALKRETIDEIIEEMFRPKGAAKSASGRAKVLKDVIESSN